MAGERETRAERDARFARERREDEEDRLPVSVRRQDGSEDFDRTVEVNASNAMTDMFRRNAADRGGPTERRHPNPRIAVQQRAGDAAAGYKKGGKVKKLAKGGAVKRDGCAARGKTKGRII